MKYLKIVILTCLCLFSKNIFARNNALFNGKHTFSKKYILLSDSLTLKFDLDSVKFLNSNNYHSIKDILGKYYGKTILIHLWATWCPACLKDFEEYNNLEMFLKNRNIVHLFISFDKIENISKWEEDIRKFNLKGIQIRANKDLQDSVTQLIWGGKDIYSLPFNLLIDKTGNVVNKRTIISTENVEMAKSQIDSLINLKTP